VNTERWAAGAGYFWLVVVGACVAVMSWTGLVGFAEDNLHMPPPRSYMVPFALDGAAVTCAFFGLRSVMRGDAAIFPRLLAWIVIGASAAANYYHAWSQDQGEAAALFFAGMTLLVYLLFEVVLRQVRREQLREKHAIEQPLPRFRLARWARFPRRTFRAWSAAVEHGLTDPAEAIRRAEVQVIRGQVLEAERPTEEVEELEVTETRSIRARSSNGTMAARIRELHSQGQNLDAIVAATSFPRETVARTIRRIEQQRSSS
jgi:hypothetical protein